MSDQTYNFLRASQEEAQDKRALWERPAVRRLAANNAESGHSNLDDGNCTGTGSDFTHSCKSDRRLKHELVRVGQFLDSVGLYRFKYLWDERDYVGVIAQEVAGAVPDAVREGADGYLRVNYARLGLTVQTWEDWLGDQPSLN
jgi:hypothetical protein